MPPLLLTPPAVKLVDSTVRRPITPAVALALPLLLQCRPRALPACNSRSPSSRRLVHGAAVSCAERPWSDERSIRQAPATT